MRYFLPSCHLILLCLVITLFAKFFDCRKNCQRTNRHKERKTVFESDLYRYSHYYFYSETIRLDQPRAVLSDSFETLSASKDITPKLKFKFYGTNVSKIQIDKCGHLTFHDEDDSGFLVNFIKGRRECKTEISNEENLFAIRNTFRALVNGERLVFKIINMIHPNGKISFYYEDVPKHTKEGQVVSFFYGLFVCDHGVRIKIPHKWIKSGTLVEYEVLGECPEQNTVKECQDAKALDTTCIWYEKENMCIASNDKNIKDIKIISCKNKMVSSVDDSTNATLIKEEETSSATTETDTTNELKKHHVINIKGLN